MGVSQPDSFYLLTLGVCFFVFVCVCACFVVHFC